MSDDTPPHRDRSRWQALAIGGVTLAAWFALLWFRFGDVLWPGAATVPVNRQFMLRAATLRRLVVSRFHLWNGRYRFGPVVRP